jgi:hypothetical protein
MKVFALTPDHPDVKTQNAPLDVLPDFVLASEAP